MNYSTVLAIPAGRESKKMNYTIKPANSITGSLSVPGDKSISHRALMLGAIAKGETQIINLSSGRDVVATWNCLAQLGIKIEKKNNRTHVHGKGLYGLISPKKILNAENSGTTMRLLSGILAAQPFESTIKGDNSLKKRPMTRIIQPLTLMGAKIESNNGKAPLKIKGGKLKGIKYKSPIASAQVKSSLLLAGLYASGKTSIEEPFQSRDHTERMLSHFGVAVKKNNLKIEINGPVEFMASSINVPGDISSAAFFMVAASIVPGSKILIPGVGINPTRKSIIDVLKKMGAKIKEENKREENLEPTADITVESSQLRSIKISGAVIPGIIDEIPILAVAATQAEGETIIRNARELRFKESDRIKTVTKNLRKMGAKLEELDDGFIIPGPQKLKGAVVESFGDHRIAIAFSIAGLIAEGETTIRETECVEISFPGFFETLTKLL